MFRRRPKIMGLYRYPEWIYVEDYLPPLFSPVIVYGIVAELGVMKHAYEARRWSGHSGNEAGRDWTWLTPNDRPVKAVTYWIPMPMAAPK